MFIKKTKKTVKGKTYVNHLLVESVSTPKGPRHRVVCSLGSLEPGPPEQWRALAHKMDQALAGQRDLFPCETVDQLVAQVQARDDATTELPASPGTTSGPAGGAETDLVAIHTDQVQVEEARQAGPQHVGHQMWQRLDLDAILASAGLHRRAQLLTQIMTLNRLIAPCAEHAMPAWIQRTALADLLDTDLSGLDDNALYRHLDRLHPQRGRIEEQLSQRERTLFDLAETLYIYDLTSTYFEGQCLLNPQAQRGYSRDHRPDCKQVVVGLVIDEDGFPKAHEVFAGQRQDRTTVAEMLALLEQRTGGRPGATVIVDRGMAFEENLAAIQAHEHHYLVACRQAERDVHEAAFTDEDGWKEVIRVPSPTNPAQRKTPVWVKQQRVGDELHVLCRSAARAHKDRAIREKQEQRLRTDLEKLQARIAKGQLKALPKVHEAIGRIKERYPRVARYYQIDYDPQRRALTWHERVEKKRQAEQLDGAYLLKTDRLDLSEQEIWRTYSLLTRVETAFRAMKSPLMERPIFHQLQHRVETNIFLCVLAYHLLVAIEKAFLDQGLHTSWATLREQLSTHQVVTVCLPASNGDVLKIRRATRPEPIHQDIYQTLDMPTDLMKSIKTWHPAGA